MLNKDDGKNKTIWCGEVVGPLEVDHVYQEMEESQDTYYRFHLKTVVKTNKDRLLDESLLPMVINEKLLNGLDKTIEEGDILFLRGSWRAYTVGVESKSRRVEQIGVVEEIAHSELRAGKYLNRYEFEGYLVEKLYLPEKDERSKPKVDSKTGKFIPLLDEKGKKQWTVRLNKEKKVVNDFTIAINEGDRSFYIPSLSFFNLAHRIANEFPIGSKVKGAGYIRSRTYVDRRDIVRTAYEAVVVSLEIVHEEKNEDILS